MMRSTPFLFCTVFFAVAACGRPDRRTDSATGAASAGNTAAAAAASPAAPAAPTLSLTQVEGRWRGQSLAETKDTVIATWTIDAPADTSKWVAKFTNGPTVPIHIVSIAGDSLVAQMGPYPSVSMKGQKINVRFVARTRGDSLLSTFESRPVAKPDSVVRGRARASRIK